MVRKFPTFRSERKKRTSSEGSLRARSIRPKFPEIPVQNRMEQKFSGNSFRKFRFTSRGSPYNFRTNVPQNYWARSIRPKIPVWLCEIFICRMERYFPLRRTDLYSDAWSPTANDPQTRKIPKLDRKWSRTQMILDVDRKWSRHGMAWKLFFGRKLFLRRQKIYSLRLSNSSFSWWNEYI